MKRILLLMPLVALLSCSKDDDISDKDETQEPIALSSYEGVELKLVDSDTEDYGVGFSASDGKVYFESEINEETISKIDFLSLTYQALIAFDSPHESDFTASIAGAKTTKIDAGDVAMTADEFDALTNEQLLDLDIVTDSEAQPIDYKGVILFETAEGRKGAIKINYLNAQRIHFDVKVSHTEE